MAIKKVFTVFDSKAEAYLQPFFAVTEGVATRTFIAAASDPDHDFNRFAEDYTLFELGEFDESTGRFDQLNAPKSILNGITVKEFNDAAQ